MGTMIENDRFIIEFYGEAAGMVIKDDGGFVFHAARPELWSLNRRVFDSVDAARRATREFLERSRWAEAEGSTADASS